MKKISTSALSKALNISTKKLFEQLQENKFITRVDDSWVLTPNGEAIGGEIKKSERYGEYIVWPSDLSLEMKTDHSGDESKVINATTIGKKFNVSSRRINLVLTEIGWIEKSIKGWEITALGKKVGGKKVEHQSGRNYVLWPQEILDNESLIRSMDHDSSESTKPETNSSNNFRNKFPAKIRTKDGHNVRSRAEAIIDNALYDYGLAHAYERKLPIEETLYSDFYIPSKNGGKAVYIEFWGLENDPKYLARKKIKQGIYKKYELNLIELEDKHIENLDDDLPRMLLKFDIKVE